MTFGEENFRTGGSHSFVHMRDGEAHEGRGVFHPARENDFAIQTELLAR